MIVPCLDCGEPIRVRMRDGELLSVDPPGVVGHSNIAYSSWREDMHGLKPDESLPVEEHVRRWLLFDPASEDGIRPIVEFAARFGLPIFRERSAPDYLQRLPALRQELLARLGTIR